MTRLECVLVVLNQKRLDLTPAGMTRVAQWLQDPVEKHLVDPWYDVGRVAGIDGVELVATDDRGVSCMVGLLPEHIQKRPVAASVPG